MANETNGQRMDVGRAGLGISLLVLSAIAALAIVGRGLSQAWPNVAPIAAAALLGGYVVGRRFGRPRLAVLVPMGALLASDLLWFGSYEFGVMATVYAAFIVSGLLGRAIARASWWRIGGAALLSAGLFFVTTNAAVWAFTAYYPRTIEGLLLCYTNALPFLRFTVIGDLLFSAVFFAGYAGVARAIESWRAGPRGLTAARLS